MPTGTKLRKGQKTQINKMHQAGYAAAKIAKEMKLGESTVYRVIAGKKRRPVRTDYSVGATREDWEYISDYANQNRLTKGQALTEIIKKAKSAKKRWWSWS